MENIGRTLDDINLSKILYDPPPRVMELKTEVNKWGLIKLKCFCTVKETISKVKRQPSEWKKIIPNETTDKGLISKIYKQLVQLNEEINPLSAVSFAIIFSHSEGCLFTLLIVSFALQKLLSLIRSHLFTFVFISIMLGGGS